MDKLFFSHFRIGQGIDESSNRSYNVSPYYSLFNKTYQMYYELTGNQVNSLLSIYGVYKPRIHYECEPKYNDAQFNLIYYYILK